MRYVSLQKKFIIKILLTLSISVGCLSCEPAYHYQIPEQIEDGWNTASVEDVGIQKKKLGDLVKHIRRNKYRNIHSGNSRGGVRCAQVDVPHVTYHADPVDGQAVVGTETAFAAAKLRQLYQTPANYAQRFNARLDELIGQGWFLTEDAQGMRDEAAAVRF